MEMMMMLQTVTALFSIAALGGLLMAGIRFSGRPRPPSWMAMGHGLLAAAGLTLLMYAAIVFVIPILALIALALFLIAALGGAAMNLLFHAKALPLPIPLMITHATLALAGLVFLFIAVFS